MNRNRVMRTLSILLCMALVLSGLAVPAKEVQAGAEYKLTLLDDNMAITPGSSVIGDDNKITVTYSISGTNSGNATQVSLLVLDKEYTKGNTNGADVLAYEKIADVSGASASGTATFALPNILQLGGFVTEYHAYIVAEDVNDEKETDYASAPVEISLWEAPTAKKMNFGVQGIIDPAIPTATTDAWKGCYVYYGNYDGSPVKYRVLDASTTEFGGTTMLLDCDSVLYNAAFDEKTSSGDECSQIWKESSLYASLNGAGFLDKDGVFTTVEKSAIDESTKTGENMVLDGVGWGHLHYVSLDGEKIFLLDGKEAARPTYGYSDTDDVGTNRIKYLGDTAAYWWVRSDHDYLDSDVGVVDPNGCLINGTVHYTGNGVSPAFNVNLSSVLFSSASGASKSSALTNGSTEIGTTTNTDWKLTLLDKGKSVALTQGRSVTKASDGTITVPYTYTDSATLDSEKVNQISVMITDKEYKAGNTEKAQILYYGALQNTKNAEGNTSTVADASAGTGTFALPSGLTGKTQGEDYYIYLLAEHVNQNNTTTSVDESLKTDYASEPLKVEVKTAIDTVAVPSIAAPTPEQAFVTEVAITSTGVADTASLAWKKNGTEATGNAEWNTAYQAYVTLTAADGYAFTDTTKATLNESDVSTADITLNDDGTLTVICGEYTTATRKIKEVAAPKVPTQFSNDYTEENVCSSKEFGTTAKVTLQGSTQPSSVDMDVTWSVVDEAGDSAEYDDTPTATNIFKWTIIPSEYADYDLNGVTMEGTVTIQNKRYEPLVTAIPTVADRVYHPTKVLADTDLIGGEVKGKDGTALTGTWSWKEKNVVPSVADSEKTNFEIIFTPDDSEHYESITKMVKVKVTKATPVVVTKPVATTITVGNTLATSTLSDGKVLYSGNDTIEVEGTFSWKNATIKPAATDSGVTEYTVVFTPKDTVNYETVETKVTVVISTPEVGTTAPSDDGTATYKVTTSDLSNGTVTYVAPTNKKKTTVTIPDTVTIDGVTYKVTSIEKNAFKNSKIKKVTVGNNIETIGANAFSGCKKLTSVKLGKNVKSIGDKAFYKCTALTKITIPSKVSTIGKSAFEGCKKLKTVAIGKSVTKIGAKAFYGCSKLKTLTIKSTKLTTKKIGSKAFSKTPKSMTVKVPKKKFKAYKSMLVKKGVSKTAKFKKS